jgi:hypothetical protein
MRTREIHKAGKKDEADGCCYENIFDRDLIHTRLVNFFQYTIPGGKTGMTEKITFI